MRRIVVLLTVPLLFWATARIDRADAGNVHCFDPKDLVAAQNTVKDVRVERYFRANMLEAEVAAVDLCLADEKKTKEMLSKLPMGKALELLRAAAENADIPFARFYQAAHAAFLNQLYDREDRGRLKGMAHE